MGTTSSENLTIGRIRTSFEHLRTGADNSTCCLGRDPAPSPAAGARLWSETTHMSPHGVPRQGHPA